MIDSVALISRGGLVIWTFSPDQGSNVFITNNKCSNINQLIRDIILQEKGGDKYACLDGVHFRWNLINSLDATLFISYKGIQNTNVLVELLNACSKAIVTRLETEYAIRNNVNWFLNPIQFNFDHDFKRILINSNSNSNTNSNTNSVPQNVESGTSRTTTPVKDINTNNTNTISGRKDKKMRQWDVKTNVTKKDMDELDYSDKSEPQTTLTTNSTLKPSNSTIKFTNSTMKFTNSTRMKPTNTSDTTNTIFKSLLNSVKSVFKRGNVKSVGKSPELLDKFTTLVLKYSGNMMITEESLVTPISILTDKLRSKNVAGDICEMIGRSIVTHLVGKRTESLRSLSSTVRTALESSVRRILTPKDPINLIKQVKHTVANGGIYSIVFLGVNGVGKSTSLAKVAYLLKSNGFKVLVVACDTFRSGAVEQLKTHTTNLGLHLFERGYGKDPAQIAKEGIKHAVNNQFDVVLIDTAGRMQDNEPLMAALTKLIVVNNPNLIIFVGEALVGNDAVDQLKKFNLAIGKGTDRTIDALLLTKFDTVDDKVGAALSMVYITGKPILFVGNGQTYSDLQPLNIELITQFLLT
ncbi:SRP54-type GTPase domain protein [Theileria parva strain Muguga]|uniref:Signal recognition particle receptor alpha subunit, putative n=1 Tax=Theileria parva TaxID=5875 RepID=Q4N567_THEPA|nr:signal recognition particle receptor subunit alpha [Theileria parva strain Muguga]EAN32706.1 SRP54-type GTPase domain protein [Theileria parva strain Muguga]|eukprot:XP_764989.1 signal recognition particle receptor subunit alpha [Theileria parva strain Muguga]